MTLKKIFLHFTCCGLLLKKATAFQDSCFMTNIFVTPPFTVASGVWFDSSSSLFVSDFIVGKVTKITNLDTLRGGVTVAGSKSGSLPTGDGSPATSADVATSPLTTCGAPNGDLFLMDQAYHNNIRKVTAESGIISLVAGFPSFTGGYTGDNGPATSARINSATQCTVMPNGDLLFTDFRNNRLRLITQSGTVLSHLLYMEYNSTLYCIILNFSI